MNRIRKWLRDHKQFVLYTLFGAVTVTVEFSAYFLCYDVLSIPATISNMIAWVFGVIAAFLTNKPFVFHSHDWSWSTVLLEGKRFALCRLGSGLTETVIMFVAVDLVQLNGNIVKIVTTAGVIAFNYFASHYYVFRARRQE